MTPVTDTWLVRSAALERFTRLLAGADSATRTLAAWCGEPPATRIHTREETATLPEEAVLLGLPPTTTVQRRHITHRRRDGTVLCEAEADQRLEHQARAMPSTQPAGPGRLARVAALARRARALAARTT